MVRPAVAVCPPPAPGTKPARVCPLCGDGLAVPPAARAAVALGSPAACRGCAPAAADRLVRRRLNGTAPKSLPARAKSLAPPARIDPAPHLKWARSVARGVGADYKFARGSAEEQDLEGVAYLTLCELAAAFDPRFVPRGGNPGGAFRGWAHATIRKQCHREALRLRNGGTYRTRRERDNPPLKVPPLSDIRNDDGEQWEPAEESPDPEPEGDDGPAG